MTIWLQAKGFRCLCDDIQNAFGTNTGPWRIRNIEEETIWAPFYKRYFECVSLNGILRNLILISLEFVCEVLINNKQTLVYRVYTQSQSIPHQRRTNLYIRVVCLWYTWKLVSLKQSRKDNWFWPIKGAVLIDATISLRMITFTLFTRFLHVLKQVFRYNETRRRPIRVFQQLQNSEIIMDFLSRLIRNAPNDVSQCTNLAQIGGIGQGPRSVVAMFHFYPAALKGCGVLS